MLHVIFPLIVLKKINGINSSLLVAHNKINYPVLFILYIYFHFFGEKPQCKYLKTCNRGGRPKMAEEWETPFQPASEFS